MQGKKDQEQKGKERGIIVHNMQPHMLGPMYTMLLSSIHHPSILTLP